MYHYIYTITSVDPSYNIPSIDKHQLFINGDASTGEIVAKLKRAISWVTKPNSITHTQRSVVFITFHEIGDFLPSLCTGMIEKPLPDNIAEQMGDIDVDLT